MYIVYNEEEVHRPVQGFDSVSVDLFFPKRAVEALNAMKEDSCKSGVWGVEPGEYIEIDLGIRLLMRQEEQGCLILPRSSSGAIEKSKGYLVKYLAEDETPENAIHRWDTVNLDPKDGVIIRSTKNLTLANSIGYIDWDYRGNLMARIMFPNGQALLDADRPYLQLIPLSYLASDGMFVCPENLLESFLEERGLNLDSYETIRGERGFGSSSK